MQVMVMGSIVWHAVSRMDGIPERLKVCGI